MSQPKWKRIANLGDVGWLEHGGYFVYVDETGEYPPEAELLREPAEDSDGKQWQAFRVNLETFDSEASGEWFSDDIDRCLASYSGITPEELRADFHSTDPIRLAIAYRAVGDYFGWGNLDSYPLTLTETEAKERYK